MAVFELDLYADEASACALTDEQIEQAIELVLDEEQVERPCGVSLSIVGDARMQELNFEWRGIDKCTDVLSLECERPDDPDLAPGEPCELGDIILAELVGVIDCLSATVQLVVQAAYGKPRVRLRADKCRDFRHLLQ